MEKLLLLPSTKTGDVYLYRNNTLLGQWSWRKYGGNPAKMTDCIEATQFVDLIDMKEYTTPESKKELVKRVNSVLGAKDAPVIVKKSGESGYGLFAVRPIPKGTHIAHYGGLVYKGCQDIECEKGFEDYVATVHGNPSKVYDAGRYFFPEDAGRWINEPPYGLPYLANAKEGKATLGSYSIIAKRNIKKDEEIFLAYHDDYQRTGWGAQEVLEEGNPKKINDMIKYLRELLKDNTKLVDVTYVNELLCKAEEKTKKK